MKKLYTAVRSVIKAVRTGKIQLIDVKGRGEDFTGKELFQQYGLASRPLPESEGILLFIGGIDNAVVIATEDRRYRVSLEEGEVAMYSDEGDKIHLKRNKEILIYSGNKVTVESPNVYINATTKVTVTTPTMEISGNLSVGGNITATGDIADSGGSKTMAGMRTTYNGHTHPETGTTTNAPNQGM